MGGSSLVIAGFVEALREEVVGKFSGLWKAVDAFANIEVDPTIAGFVGKSIFLDEFFEKAINHGVEVEVNDVKAIKVGIATR